MEESNSPTDMSTQDYLDHLAQCGCQPVESSFVDRILSNKIDVLAFLKQDDQQALVSQEPNQPSLCGTLQTQLAELHAQPEEPQMRHDPAVSDPEIQMDNFVSSNAPKIELK